MQQSLTAPERETVITTSDADDHIRIWTAQRRMITKLKANPAARLVDEGHHGTTAWAEFHVPAGLLTIRSGKRKVSEAQREAAGDRMRKMHADRQGA